MGQFEEQELIETKDAVEQENSEKSIDEIYEKLLNAEMLLIQERNRRIFERALENVGVRSDRLDAAWKLAETDMSRDSLDEKTAKELAQKILANYPEFAEKRKLLSTDQAAPSKGRAASSGDALEMLREMRRE